MPERCDAGAEHVSAVPKAVAVDELTVLFVLDQGVRTGDFVTRFDHFVEGVVYPGTLGRPVGDGVRRRFILAEHLQLLGEDRVERQFHLIDRDAVGRKSDGLPDTFPPVVRALADHAGYEVDVDLIESQIARPAEGAVDFLFKVGPAIELEDLWIKVLNAHAQSCHAHFAERFELVLLERAWLALEGHFGCLPPGQEALEARHQAAKLGGAQVRGSPAAEVDVMQRPAANDRHFAVKLDLPSQGLQIHFHVTGILVRVNAEIAKLAAFAAKGNMQVQAERRAWHRFRLESGAGFSLASGC